MKGFSESPREDIAGKQKWRTLFIARAGNSQSAHLSNGKRAFQPGGEERRNEREKKTSRELGKARETRSPGFTPARRS
jgi:hypothetical protein